MLCFGQISFNLWSEFVNAGIYEEKQEKKNQKEIKLKLMTN